MLHHAEPLSYARTTANNLEVMLEETLKANGLTQSPCKVFNCREVGMPKVVSNVGQKGHMLLLLATKHRSLSWHMQVPADVAFHQ